MTGPQIGWLADRRRLHMNHGPIDLILEAFGEPEEIKAAYAQAAARFCTILTELVAELGELRKPIGTAARNFASPAARRMEEAALRHFPTFITPMAAVAGSVADEVLAAMVEGHNLQRAYVNDGGDIAIHLAPGQTMRAAIAGTGHGFADRLTIRAEETIRGIATSGWRGRSHSLGIADAVTVLARDAASADVAATLIANAVDLPGHPAITRVPACAIDPDTDLGERLVTQAVGPLAADEIAQALERGLAVADDARRRGLIEAAALFLASESRFSSTTRLSSLPSGGLSHTAFPHSVRFAATSPSLRGVEEKGPSNRLFLSPVDRGRGGARSATEWGSTAERSGGVTN